MALGESTLPYNGLSASVRPYIGWLVPDFAFDILVASSARVPPCYLSPSFAELTLPRRVLHPWRALATQERDGGNPPFFASDPPYIFIISIGGVASEERPTAATLMWGGGKLGRIFPPALLCGEGPHPCEASPFFYYK